ncbi:MAG: flavoprotein [Puniceicoccales bacterium]
MQLPTPNTPSPSNKISLAPYSVNLDESTGFSKSLVFSVATRGQLLIVRTLKTMTKVDKDSPSSLAGKTIILGVCGSIAAYRAADITSRMTQQGASVYPVMTEEATRLIAPLTLKTLARNPVAWDLWKEGEGWQPGHIELADNADLFLVAPATAHTLACFAQGLAPDLLTSIYLATRAPVLLAPAMNGKMLAHPATQTNLEALRKRGHHFIEPAEGMLACGYEGKGRLAPVDQILTAAADLLSAKNV